MASVILSCDKRSQKKAGTYLLKLAVTIKNHLIVYLTDDQWEDGCMVNVPTVEKQFVDNEHRFAKYRGCSNCALVGVYRK